MTPEWYNMKHLHLDSSDRIKLINEAMLSLVEMKTALSLARRASDARKEMIRPLLTHVGNDTIFTPTRRDLVQLANPNLTQGEMNDAFGRLSDAQQRLSNEPIRFTANRPILRSIYPQNPEFAEVSWPGTLTTKIGMSPKMISKSFLGDFEDPSHWTKKIPILYGDKYFDRESPYVLGTFQPDVLHSRVLDIDMDQNWRRGRSPNRTHLVGERGVIYARKSRIPRTPEIVSGLGPLDPQRKSITTRKIFGPSSWEILQRKGKIGSVVAHEVGHTPIGFPSDVDLAARIPSEAQKFLTTRTGYPPKYLIDDPDVQQRLNTAMYDKLPIEFVADLYAAAKKGREAGIKGAFDTGQIDRMMKYTDMFNKKNRLKTFFVPASQIDQGRGPFADPTTPLGQMSIPLDVPDEIVRSIHSNMFPYLH